MIQVLMLFACLGGQPKADTDSVAPMDADQDGDGYASPEDCDNTNSELNPSEREVCDGMDNDCDTLFDDDDPSVDPETFTQWYLDEDCDGFGIVTDQREFEPLACQAIPFDIDGWDTWCYADNAADCDDRCDTCHPGATEVEADGIDQDCDGDFSDAD